MFLSFSVPAEYRRVDFWAMIDVTSSQPSGVSISRKKTWQSWHEPCRKHSDRNVGTNVQLSKSRIDLVNVVCHRQGKGDLAGLMVRLECGRYHGHR